MTDPIDILDSPDEDPRLPDEDREHRRRSVKLFLYALGIAAILGYRFFFIGGTRVWRMMGMEGIERLFYLGIAGVWAFAGLGTYYGLAALYQREPLTIWLLTGLVGNVLFFGLGSWQLLVFFFPGEGS